MFFRPVELCSRGEVSNGNKPNEQTVCLMSAGQNKVILQMVSYFKYCLQEYTSGWIFKKVIDSFKHGVPSTPFPKLSSLKFL